MVTKRGGLLNRREVEVNVKSGLALISYSGLGKVHVIKV